MRVAALNMRGLGWASTAISLQYQYRKLGELESTIHGFLVEKLHLSVLLLKCLISQSRQVRKPLKINSYKRSTTNKKRSSCLAFFVKSKSYF